MEELSQELHNKLHDLKSHFLDLDDLLWERGHEDYSKDAKMSAQLDSELQVSFKTLTQEVKHLNHLIKQYIDGDIITETVALNFMKEASESGESNRHPNGDISLTEVLDFLNENSSTRDIRKHERRVFSNAEMENSFLLDKHFTLKGNEVASSLYSDSGLEKSLKDAIGLSNFVSSFGQILERRVIKGKPDSEIKRVMDTESDDELPDDVDFELYQLPLSKKEQDQEVEKQNLVDHGDVVQQGEIVSLTGKMSSHHHDIEMAKRLGKTINLQNGNHMLSSQQSDISQSDIDLHSNISGIQDISHDLASGQTVEHFSTGLSKSYKSGGVSIHDASNDSLENVEEIESQGQLLQQHDERLHNQLDQSQPNMSHLNSHVNSSSVHNVSNLEIETPQEFVDTNLKGEQTIRVDNDPVDQLTEVVANDTDHKSQRLTFKRSRKAHRKLNQHHIRRKLLNSPTSDKSRASDLHGDNQTHSQHQSQNQSVNQGLEASTLDDSVHDHFKFSGEASPVSDVQADFSEHTHTQLLENLSEQGTDHVIDLKDHSGNTTHQETLQTLGDSNLSFSNVDHINKMNTDIDEDDVSPDHYQLQGKPYTKQQVKEIHQDGDKYRRQTPLDLAEDREKRDEDDDSEMDSQEREEARLKKLEKLGYPKVEKIDERFDDPINAYGIPKMELTGSVKKFDGAPELQDTYHALNQMFSVPFQEMKAGLAENQEFINAKGNVPDYVNIDSPVEGHGHMHHNVNKGSRSPISDLQQGERRLRKRGPDQRNAKLSTSERRLRVIPPSSRRNMGTNRIMRSKLLSDQSIYNRHSFLNQRDLNGYKRNSRPVGSYNEAEQWQKKLMGGTEMMSKKGLKSKTERLYHNMLRMRF